MCILYVHITDGVYKLLLLLREYSNTHVQCRKTDYCMRLFLHVYIYYQNE